MTAWIRTEAGVRIALAGRGVVIGRSNACSIVVEDPEVSRRHALVIVTDAVRVIPLGKRGVIVGETTHEAPVEVEHGAVIRIGNQRFVIEREVAEHAPRWLVAIGNGRHPIHGSTFSIGGAPDDDLIVDGLAAHACAFHVGERCVAIETGDASQLVYADTELTVGALSIALRRVAEGDATTVTEQLPSAVILEMVPNGTVLRLRVGAADHTVFMPQLRGDLVVALLRPSAPCRAGDLVDDDALMHALWGRQGGTRQQLNVVIHRARRSLTEAGLVGPLLIERAPGGGATRFRLTDNATVSQV